MGATQASVSGVGPVNAMVYVDGFNLYFGLKSKGYKRYYWLDIQRLAGRLLKPGQNLEAVKYFTADIKRGTDKHQRQQTFLDALLTHTTRLEIIRGRYLVKERQCRRCGHVAQIPEEKKTDVNIATHMLVDASRDRFDVAFLISGDSDLVPPVEMIRREYPTKRILVAFPPGRKSDELKKVSHGSFWINENTLRMSQMPNPVVKPNGYRLHKPPQWK